MIRINKNKVAFNHKSASCLLTVEDYGRAKLSHVYSEQRGQHHASELMEKVIQFADNNNLELFLKVQAYGHPVQTILTNQQLVDFYRKFGFEHNTLGLVGQMARPRKKNTSYNEREMD